MPPAGIVPNCQTRWKDPMGLLTMVSNRDEGPPWAVPLQALIHAVHSSVWWACWVKGPQRGRSLGSKFCKKVSRCLRAVSLWKGPQPLIAMRVFISQPFGQITLLQESFHHKLDVQHTGLVCATDDISDGRRWYLVWRFVVETWCTGFSLAHTLFSLHKVVLLAVGAYTTKKSDSHGHVAFGWGGNLSSQSIPSFYYKCFEESFCHDVLELL